MSTAVIGATGRVGSEIVRGLLARGDTVAALVRDPGKARRAFGEPGGLHIRTTGATSSARLLAMAGSAAVRAAVNAWPAAVRRPPVQPVNSTVPPGRTLLAPCRVTCSSSRRWASMSRRAASKSNPSSVVLNRRAYMRNRVYARRTVAARAAAAGGSGRSV